jgi:hypothetical protein
MLTYIPYLHIFDTNPLKALQSIHGAIVVIKYNSCAQFELDSPVQPLLQELLAFVICLQGKAPAL